jgi:choline dehydrogenase-like flavoprotein
VRPEWTDARRAGLKAFCDTIFPSLAADQDAHGFWARKASDFGVPAALEDVVHTAWSEEDEVGCVALLDLIASSGIEGATPEAREQLVRSIAAISPEVAEGVTALQGLVLTLCYALPDAQGRNPNWPAIGYPGPLAAPTPTPKRIVPIVIDHDDVTLDADVCIVGSGAGGGVMAGELARHGLRVVVLEAGGYFNESDFTHLELWSYQNLYWRGGYQPTSDGNVLLLAGSTLGGGTLVNWENCVRTPPWVREDWAREHGLDGLDSPAFDRQVDGVLERLSANDRCNDFNGPHQKLEAGSRKLGYEIKRALRNVHPSKYDPKTAGYHGFGDLTGSRQSTVNTYLEDAQKLGARILVRSRANRIVVRGGRAVGVDATYTAPDGSTRRFSVKASNVVAACGALETPALLLRSAIGGPNVGTHLHLHPTVAVSGMYDQDQRGWWGPPQVALADEFLRLSGGYGFLVECVHQQLGVAAASIPWQSGRAHKGLLADISRLTSFIGIVRDRGSGRVGIDAAGASVVAHPLDDALDIAHLRRATSELARLHEAAGAERVLSVMGGELKIWRRGEDFDAFAQHLESALVGPRGLQTFSAHQMGSARMGADPKTSVANPSGELHDVRGVWIGDTSAFPTALGVNPMITCMALATRTAERLAERAAKP